MRLTGLLVALALLPGCSTNPITGRDQILALPAVQAAHADVSFALSTGAQSIAVAPACEQDCGEDIARFANRVAAIGARLEASARGMAPDVFERIEKFQIQVNDAAGAGTGSSAGGRIVLGTGLAWLEPTDGVIAFLVAREMAHVIARHAEENSGASIVFSVLGMLLPGFNLIARFVATRAGSSALAESWAVQQQREADEIALALLEVSGLPVRIVALELDIGIKRSRLPDDEWGARYLESAQRAERIAALPPRYAAIGN
jgi:Zn-dependent protease with chaperone function